MAALLLVHWDEDGTVSVSEQAQARIPEKLSIQWFFKSIVEAVLDAAPHDRHEAARALHGELQTRVETIEF